MKNNEIHYSNLTFFNTEMIDGNNAMPSPNGKYEIGHPNYGAVKITEFIPLKCKTESNLYLNSFKLFLIIIINIIINN